MSEEFKWIDYDEWKHLSKYPVVGYKTDKEITGSALLKYVEDKIWENKLLQANILQFYANLRKWVKEKNEIDTTLEYVLDEYSKHFEIETKTKGEINNGN